MREGVEEELQWCNFGFGAAGADCPRSEAGKGPVPFGIALSSTIDYGFCAEQIGVGSTSICQCDGKRWQRVKIG